MRRRKPRMLIALLALLNAGGPESGPVYNGRQNALSVQPPRLEAEVTVDGALTEAQWSEAAILTGFSQFAPSDGIAAADSTEVLVWYSPTAIYFGIRAFEPHGEVHATLADRDKIFADDQIQIYLGTFDDGRQATMFAVNPFGVQADGALVERGNLAGSSAAREQPDLSPDYVYESKGRLTDYGFEVEIRIPFKSLRYQSKDLQSWGINVVRQVRHSGYEDTWTPARRANASFLSQSGSLTGLTGLRRGLVLDLTPEITAQVTGAPQPGGWDYDSSRPEVGGNLRWGITNNLSFNATANPDFSQVESDAGQISFDPRQALFFPEKRPFFLDGIELFNTPTTMVYTRRIVQPVSAVKLTGKAMGTDLALLSAVDDRSVSGTPTDHPVFNILRAQRDLGARSRFGVVYTDREEGRNFNRVAGADTRLLFGKIYTLQFQGLESWTRRGATSLRAPLWLARFNRSGRTFGLRYLLTGVHEDFRTETGFIGRPGVAHASLVHLLTVYGRRGSLVESFTPDVTLDGTWGYQDFVHGRASQDRKLHFNANATLKGGWGVGASMLVESFGYDTALYAGYALQVPAAGGAGLDTVAFVGTPRIKNWDYVLSFATPEFSRFSGSAYTIWGHDENFFEWATGNILYMDLVLSWRPTDKLRVNAEYQLNQYRRRTDGSLAGRQRIPRLKLEYQLSRPIFLRLIGEYNAFQRDSLHDDTRTGLPILIFDPEVGDYVRAGRVMENQFRGDVLFSYQPNPGTVFFAGYGSSLDEQRPFRFGLRRRSDNFFLKLSYLFRL